MAIRRGAFALDNPIRVVGVPNADCWSIAGRPKGRDGRPNGDVGGGGTGRATAGAGAGRPKFPTGRPKALVGGGGGATGRRNVLLGADIPAGLASPVSDCGAGCPIGGRVVRVEGAGAPNGPARLALTRAQPFILASISALKP